jgi:hypothetical protein
VNDDGTDKDLQESKKIGGDTPKNSPKIKMRLGEGTTKSLALSNTHHDFTNENFVIPVHYGEKT